MKKTLNIVLTLALVFTTAGFGYAGESGSNAKFSDFASSHWAYSNVKVLVEEGAIGGYPDGTFRPSGNITCAEFIKIAMVQAGFDGAGGVGAKWYSPYVDFAYDKGIIEKGIFADNSWNKPITRDKMCYVIAKVGEYLGEDFSYTSEIKSGMDLAVTDVKSMSEPYKTCVYKAISKGIVTGYANNKHFEPSWNATRAEASAMLSRLTDKTLRVTTHFVSTIKKGTKEMVDAMPKVYDTETLAPANNPYGTNKNNTMSAKDYLTKEIEYYKSTVIFDKDNECKCAVGYAGWGDNGKYKSFTPKADLNFFKARLGEIDFVYTYIYYKDGSLDNSTNPLLNGYYGQDIDNVALVILDVSGAKGQEAWVIENPIIDKENKVYSSYNTLWYEGY